VRLIYHILSYKILSFMKTTTQMKVSSVIKSLASIIVFGGFAYTAYVFTFNSIRYMLEIAHMGTFLLHRFLSMLLYVFFLSVNVGNVIVSFATLYRSKETAYLLTKPVSHTELFIIKFFDNFFYSSATLLMIAIAVLVGYGTYFELPWTFYINTLAFLFFPFMLIAASLGVTALILLVILAGKIGPKATMVSIVFGYVGVVVAYFKMTNPGRLVQSVMVNFPFTEQYFGYLDPPASKYLPNHWIIETLYWNLKGDMTEVLSNSAILIVTCLCCLAVMILAAKRFYYRSWLVSLEMKARKETDATSRGLFSFTKSSFFERQTEVLLKKEIFQFFREPSQWIHLGIILLLIIIFVASIFQLQLGSNNPYLETIAYLVMFMFNAFLITSIALRFVYPIVSVEGLSFWKVRSAPVHMRNVYWLKFLLAILPVLFMNEILMIASHHAIAHHRMVVLSGLITSVFVVLASVSLNLGMGTLFADYRETNPIKISSSQGATITFLLSIAYLVLLIALMFFPLFGYFQMVFKHVPFSSTFYFVSYAITILASIIIIIVSHLFGLREIKRDF